MGLIRYWIGAPVHDNECLCFCTAWVCQSCKVVLVTLEKVDENKSFTHHPVFNLIFNKKPIRCDDSGCGESFPESSLPETGAFLSISWKRCKVEGGEEDGKLRSRQI